MAIYSFDEMREHSGHEIEVAVYGEPHPINVTIECMSCNRILVSLDPSQHLAIEEDPNIPGSCSECFDLECPGVMYCPNCSALCHGEGESTSIADHGRC